MQKKTYCLESNKVKQEIKICQIFDIHYKKCFSVKKLAQIINSISDSMPDYICIFGDLIDDAKDLGDLNFLISFLEALTKIAPVIMGLGNHDLLALGKDKKWFHYVNEEYFSMLKNIPKFHLVDNSTWKDDKVEFTGITMPFTYYERCHESIEYTKAYLNSISNQLLKSKDKHFYQILLFHSPISILTAREDGLECLDRKDLILSGHMHGGLTPPFLEKIFGKRGIIGPTNLKMRTIFPDYVRGRVNVNGTDAVISTGISKLNIPGTEILLPPSINEVIIKQKVLKKNNH